MNGEDYTDKDIVFNADFNHDYSILYTITDNLVYNKNGVITEKAYEVTKALKMRATVIKKGADAPAFAFY